MKNLGKALIAIGILGVICCAESLETSLTTFILSEAVAFGIALIGLHIENRKAETEASANTMENSKSLNS